MNAGQNQGVSSHTLKQITLSSLSHHFSDIQTDT